MPFEVGDLVRRQGLAPLRQEPRLAHAGLAHDPHHLPLAALRPASASPAVQPARAHAPGTGGEPASLSLSGGHAVAGALPRGTREAAQTIRSLKAAGVRALPPSFGSAVRWARTPAPPPAPHAQAAAPAGLSVSPTASQRPGGSLVSSATSSVPRCPASRTHRAGRLSC